MSGWKSSDEASMLFSGEEIWKITLGRFEIVSLKRGKLFHCSTISFELTFGICFKDIET
jgi:hypothetical protein